MEFQTIDDDIYNPKIYGSATFDGSLQALGFSMSSVDVDPNTTGVQTGTATAGQEIELHFTIDNPNSFFGQHDASNVSFQFDVAAFHAGHQAINLPAGSFCGSGSSASLSSGSSSFINFSNLSVAEGASCNFTIGVLTPESQPAATLVYRTSALSAPLTTINQTVTSAYQESQIGVVAIQPPTIAMNLPLSVEENQTFSIQLEFSNPNTSLDMNGALDFDTAAFLSGLKSAGAVQFSCANGTSQISGAQNSYHALRDFVIPKGGSCTIEIPTQVPSGTSPGSYQLTTSQVSGFTSTTNTQIIGTSTTEYLQVAASAPPPTTPFNISAVQVTNPLPSGPSSQTSSYTVTVTNPNAIDAKDASFGVAFNHGGTVTGLNMSYGSVSGCTTTGWTGLQPASWGVVADGGTVPAYASCTVNLSITSDGTVPPGNYSLVASAEGEFNGTPVSDIPVLADIVVSDTTAPTISGTPSDIATVATSASGANVTWTAPTASDNDSANLTSSHNSGDLFPIGITTVTYTATDPAGNQTQESFKITVIDGAAPIITVPNDVVVGADAGQSTAVVTFAVTATDLADGDLTSSIILSHASGDTFPLGETVITADVTDSDSNAATQTSFKITVTDGEKPIIAAISNQAAVTSIGATTAQVSFSTTVSDNVDAAGYFTPVYQIGTTTITSPYDFPIGTSTVTVNANDDSSGNTPDPITFDVVITDSNGTGPTSTISGMPIGFKAQESFVLSVTFSEAVTGFELSDVSVNGGNATSLTGSGTTYQVTIMPTGALDRILVSVPGNAAINSAGLGNVVSNVVFIINLTESETKEIIAGLLKRRGELILASQPNRQRRIDRINGAKNGRTGVNLSYFGFSNFINAPVNASLSDQSYSYNFSSPITGFSQSQIDGERANLEFWSEGKINILENADGSDGMFAIAHLGVDLLVSDKLLLGAAAQFDWIDQKASVTTGEQSGYGWIAGPYALYKLSDNLYFDVRTGLGQSQNTISPYGTYKDNFTTDRQLFSAALVGEFNVDNWTISPTLSFDYLKSSQRAYTNGLGANISAQDVISRQMSFSPRISYQFQLGEDVSLTPWAELVGTLDFSQSSIRTDIRGGAEYSTSNNSTISLGLNYDGIGKAENAYGISARISSNF
ncbi:MAG: HYR domain-containing protein [Lentilitoribacter sp.]